MTRGGKFPVGKLTADVVVLDSVPQKMQGFLTLLGKTDGTPGVETLLPAAPVHHGVCVASGRAIVCLEDGSVACLGQ